MGGRRPPWSGATAAETEESTNLVFSSATKRIYESAADIFRCGLRVCAEAGRAGGAHRLRHAGTGTQFSSYGYPRALALAAASPSAPSRPRHLLALASPSPRHRPALAATSPSLTYAACGGPLRGLWRATRPVAGRYAACGGPLRGLWRAATRPGFRAATRPTSSHSRYVTKAYHSNSVIRWFLNARW